MPLTTHSFSWVEPHTIIPKYKMSETYQCQAYLPDTFSITLPLNPSTIPQISGWGLRLGRVITIIIIIQFLCLPNVADFTFIDLLLKLQENLGDGFEFFDALKSLRKSSRQQVLERFAFALVKREVRNIWKAQLFYYMLNTPTTHDCHSHTHYHTAHILYYLLYLYYYPTPHLAHGFTPNANSF